MTRPAPAGRGWSSPRTFCGEHYPWPLVAELTDGLEIAACYVVRAKQRLETRHNKPYLKLTLGDRSGEIIAYVWDDSEQWDPACAEDGVVGVRARVGVFQDRLQLRVQAVEPLEPEADDLERLLPVSPRERELLERELDALVASVADPALRALLRRCVGKATELGRAFRRHPAAKRNHHAYIAGLLEHSVSVASAAARLAVHYAEQGIDVDRDLLVSGALLHDIGKIRELGELPGSGYTDAGQLLGHIVLGIQLVAREAAAVPSLSEERLLLLQHLIASHQGKPEWDSPKVPQLAEALILHYVDDLDAKLSQARALLSSVEPGSWSIYDRSLARSLYRPHPPSRDAEPGAAEPAASGEVVIDLFRA